MKTHIILGTITEKIFRFWARNVRKLYCSWVCWWRI